VVQGSKLPKFLQEILEEGGLVEHRRRHPRVPTLEEADIS
jgi:hypothetical protein